MKDLYWIWPDCIASQTCDDIKAECDKLPKIEGTISQNNSANSEVRRSQISWVNVPEIKHMMLDIGHNVNRQAYGFNIYSSIETFDLQYTEYEASYSGKYDWHFDINLNSHMLSNRKLTVILQLTDPHEYEGGDLELNVGRGTQENLKNLKKGTAIIFPSFILHKVNPLISGKRNSLIAWLEGPHFQ